MEISNFETHALRNTNRQISFLIHRLAMEIADICPFGRNPKFLNSKLLTQDEKYWLGREIVDRRQSVKDLVNKYQILRNIS